jgi:hypothetical protein
MKVSYREALEEALKEARKTGHRRYVHLLPNGGCAVFERPTLRTIVEVEPDGRVGRTTRAPSHSSK